MERWLCIEALAHMRNCAEGPKVVLRCIATPQAGVCLKDSVGYISFCGHYFDEVAGGFTP